MESWVTTIVNIYILSVMAADSNQMFIIYREIEIHQNKSFYIFQNPRKLLHL